MFALSFKQIDRRVSPTLLNSSVTQSDIKRNYPRKKWTHVKYSRILERVRANINPFQVGVDELLRRTVFDMPTLDTDWNFNIKMTQHTTNLLNEYSTRSCATSILP